VFIMSREHLYSKKNEDTTRATDVLHVSRLDVLIANFLLFVFPIPCVTPFYVFVSVCHKIDFLGVSDRFLRQEFTLTDSFRF